MDPCPFVRILVGNLALRFSGSSESSWDCYCKIKLKDFPDQGAQIPLVKGQNLAEEPYLSPLSNSIAACFSFSKSQIENILQNNKGCSSKSSTLKIDVYSSGNSTSCVAVDKLLGRVFVPLDLRGAESKPSIVHNGWVAIGGNKKASSPELYLTVKTEPDPRFVFQFDGEPECSPQVFQVQGSVKQAVFTCKFGFRNSGGDRPRSVSSEFCLN